MTLNPGDLLFVGWDSDSDDIAFVATTDISPGEVIYFTDDEWNGNAFNTNEQLMEWTVPAQGIPAGSVIKIDMDIGAQMASIDAGGSFDYIRGFFGIGSANEMFWAFQGTRVGDAVTPSNFIAVIGNEADGSFRQTPNLNGTGLTPENGALVIDGDEDYMEWTGESSLPDPVDRHDLIASILDPSNWTTADGFGNSNPNPGGGFHVNITSTIVCFLAGTKIATATGESQAIETLAIGDVIRTAAGHDAPIRWIGHREIGTAALKKNEKLRPVKISKGALGEGLPERDLWVSRQHRLLIRSKIAHRMFGNAHALVAAIRLTELPGIYVDDTVTDAQYYHLAFDQHEIIYADGMPAESLLPGPQTWAAITPRSRSALSQIYPKMMEPDYVAAPAAYIPQGKAQKNLVARHLKNAKPLWA